MGCTQYGQHTDYLIIDGWPRLQHKQVHHQMMYGGKIWKLDVPRKYKFFFGRG
jgi:hypothetical protein